MNVLVTGGAGFIGSHVVRRIIGEPAVRRVVNLDCLTYAGRLENVAEVSGDPKYMFERVDLRDKPAVIEATARHEVTHVMHLAAESHVDRSITGPDDFIHTNFVGTFHLLEGCRAWWKEAGGNRFLQVSTDEVYGSVDANTAFAEGSRYAPSSPYSATKAAADMLVQAYRRTYALPVVTAICSNNYGPNQYPEKLIPVVIECIRARKAIPVYGDGLASRDWIHVADTADALWEVLRRGEMGATYHIAGNNEWTNLRLVETICDMADELAPELGGNSRRLITFVADRPGHDRRYALETSRTERELNWKPRRIFTQKVCGKLCARRWFANGSKWTAER